jgi:hypothetical protein
VARSALAPVELRRACATVREEQWNGDREFLALNSSETDDQIIGLASGGKTFSEVLAALGVPVVGLAGVALGKVLERRALTLPQVIRAFDTSMAQMKDWIDESYVSSAGAAPLVEEVFAAALRLSGRGEARVLRDGAGKRPVNSATARRRSKPDDRHARTSPPAPITATRRG